MKHKRVEVLHMPFHILRTETTACHVPTHLGKQVTYVAELTFTVWSLNLNVAADGRSYYIFLNAHLCACAEQRFSLSSMKLRFS